MKAAARILVTAAALAALSALSLAAGAHATPPQHDPPGVQRQQTTTNDAVELFRSGERASQRPATPANSGHGPQFDPDDPAPAPSQPGTDPAVTAPAGHGRQLAPVLAVTLLGLLLVLAGATWLRLRHRPREAI
jgi:hypothetical protein